MTKGSKKSDSSTSSHEIDDPSLSGILPSEATAAPSHINPLATIVKEIKAMTFNTQGYLRLDYFTLFWLFVGGSIFGLAVETLYHAIVFGGLESRAGLVWGPFSPIYGTGAVVLTVFLNRYYHSHNLVIFLFAMVIGSLLEYIASWGMEVFFGAIAWDYTGTFGSIQGRTNFFFGMMWGMLGLIWVRIFLPFVKRVFSRFNAKHLIARILTVGMSVFMVVDITCTCMALDRAKQRAHDVPADNPIQIFSDSVFPDSFIDARFENMTIAADGESLGNDPNSSTGVFF